MAVVGGGRANKPTSNSHPTHSRVTTFRSTPSAQATGSGTGSDHVLATPPPRELIRPMAPVRGLVRRLRRTLKGLTRAHVPVRARQIMPTLPACRAAPHHHHPPGTHHQT